MVRLILKLIITAGALLLIAQYVPGISVSGWYPAIIAAVILGVINLTLKPILVILTLPLTIMTLGLFTFVINALLFWFAATFIEGFSIVGFIPALVGAFILSVVSWLTHQLL